MSCILRFARSARFLLFVAVLALPEWLSAQVPVDPGKATVEAGTAWFNLPLVGLEGQGWTDTAAPFDRFPARAQSLVRDSVWSLSRNSAGLCARFETDAPEIRVRWTLTSDQLAMKHMPATGVSGVDLYVRHQGQWKWLAIGQPAARSNTARLVSGLPAERREYLLYLPLYNGVSSVELGLPVGTTLRSAAPRAAGRKPIVFYGTSITQGGCASRPGMVHTAILGRWLETPVINLGFSGNGRMELEVARLMAELDASIFVIDCLPNIGAAEVRDRTEPLVAALREKHPTVPIVLVEDRSFSDSFLIASKRAHNEASRAALKVVFEKLTAAGDAHLHYLPGEDLLGADNEGTVDSSHPTDLGFLRQAEAFQRVLKPLLK